MKTEKLILARDLINKGWCRGSFAKNKSGNTLVPIIAEDGAVLWASHYKSNSFEMPKKYDLGGALLQVCGGFTKDYLDANEYIKKETDMYTLELNDSHGTTKRSLLKTINKLISKLNKERELGL